MDHQLTDNDSTDMDHLHLREPAFVAICADQLKLAIDESRVEMDALTAAAMSTGDATSIDMITRLQSVDRLMQRLWNVHANLEQFAQFLNKKHNSGEKMTWNDLLDRSRATFTMEQEREMFDAALGSSQVHTRDASNDLMLFVDEGSDV